MTERAAHLVDHVLPDVPVRQWALTVPHRIRYLLAWRHDLCKAVVRVLLREVHRHLRTRARASGLGDVRGGAVAVVQRFPPHCAQSTQWGPRVRWRAESECPHPRAMVEHIDVFEAVVPEALLPANQDGEVERVECLAPEALVGRLAAGAFTLEAALMLAESLRRRGLV